MCCNNDFLKLFNTANFELKKGSTDKKSVQLLQNILFELGYGKTLNWEKYGADGDYGKLTSKAVLLFIGQNNLAGDGETITLSIAESLIKRLDSLDELQLLQNHIDTKKIKEIYYKGSPNKEAIQSLQTLLNELGYGKELKWDVFKNDGDYGNCTSVAISAYAKSESITSNGEKLTISLAKLMVKKLSSYYGKDWNKDTIIALISDNSNPLNEFKASHFVGKTITADKDFIPALNRINAYAEKNDIKIHITSSFRKTAIVRGAIVTPAKMSNHMIGHAIDMNIRYGDNYSKWCNSNCLAQSYLPEPIANFIQDIRNDEQLRWGGDFRKRDTVHIDDHYNKDPEKWRLKYEQIQAAL
ncbi:MAG: M15 family metallopeptidase [Flavobacteriales bacterium]|nr:M15 family metallopeptidase [Flavobacteriales bacterium]MCB9364192.1 M15 family metallopeptidase [Flavobacteriales bacterium]